MSIGGSLQASIALICSVWWGRRPSRSSTAAGGSSIVPSQIDVPSPAAASFLPSAVKVSALTMPANTPWTRPAASSFAFPSFQLQRLTCPSLWPVTTWSWPGRMAAQVIRGDPGLGIAELDLGRLELSLLLAVEVPEARLGRVARGQQSAAVGGEAQALGRVVERADPVRELPALHVPDADELGLRGVGPRHDPGPVGREGRTLEGESLGDLERAERSCEEVRLEDEAVAIRVAAGSNQLRGVRRGVGGRRQDEGVVVDEGGGGPAPRQPSAGTVFQVPDLRLQIVREDQEVAAAGRAIQAEDFPSVGSDRPGLLSPAASLEAMRRHRALATSADHRAAIEGEADHGGTGVRILVDQLRYAVAVEPPGLELAEARGASGQVSSVGREGQARGGAVREVGGLGGGPGPFGRGRRYQSQAPLVAHGDPAAGRDRQASYRRGRRLVLGLLVAADVAEGDLTGGESQRQGAAVGRDRQGGRAAEPRGDHGAATAAGVEQPDRAVVEEGGDRAVVALAAAGELQASEVSGRPGLGLQGDDREVAQHGAAVAVDRDEMPAVGQHPDQVHPYGVRRPRGGRKREVAQVAELDRAPAAPDDHPPVVAAEPHRRGPRGLPRPDVEQAPSVSDQARTVESWLDVISVRLSAVTARLVTLSACPAWRTTSGRGGGSFLAKLPLQRFNRGGTRPIARNPWSPSLESC